MNNQDLESNILVELKKILVATKKEDIFSKVQKMKDYGLFNADSLNRVISPGKTLSDEIQMCFKNSQLFFSNTIFNTDYALMILKEILSINILSKDFLHNKTKFGETFFLRLLNKPNKYQVKALELFINNGFVNSNLFDAQNSSGETAFSTLFTHINQRSQHVLQKLIEANIVSAGFFNNRKDIYHKIVWASIASYKAHNIFKVLEKQNIVNERIFTTINIQGIKLISELIGMRYFDDDNKKELQAIKNLISQKVITKHFLDLFIQEYNKENITEYNCNKFILLLKQSTKNIHSVEDKQFIKEFLKQYNILSCNNISQIMKALKETPQIILDQNTKNTIKTELKKLFFQQGDKEIIKFCKEFINSVTEESNVLQILLRDVISLSALAYNIELIVKLLTFVKEAKLDSRVIENIFNNPPKEEESFIYRNFQKLKALIEEYFLPEYDQFLQARLKNLLVNDFKTHTHESIEEIVRTNYSCSKNIIQSFMFQVKQKEVDKLIIDVIEQSDKNNSGSNAENHVNASMRDPDQNQENSNQIELIGANISDSNSLSDSLSDSNLSNISYN